MMKKWTQTHTKVMTRDRHGSGLLAEKKPPSRIVGFFNDVGLRMVMMVMMVMDGHGQFEGNSP